MCVLFKPKPKPPPYFSASYHPNHTDFPLFRKVPVCTADIIARCVLRRRQRLNHTRFWQPLMEMLEGEKKKKKKRHLCDFLITCYTWRCSLCCGRWLTNPHSCASEPCPDSNEFILDGALFFSPAQLSQLFSVLFQCHRCCLPQPHPLLHQQHTEVCPL